MDNLQDHSQQQVRVQKTQILDDPTLFAPPQKNFQQRIWYYFESFSTTELQLA